MTPEEAIKMLPKGKHIDTLYNACPDRVRKMAHRGHVIRMIERADLIRRTPPGLPIPDRYGVAIDTGMGTVFVETVKCSG